MFKILSLDGGGIRGAFTASLIAEIESRLEKPIGTYFDLVAGTSTGGLIAASVACGIPAINLLQFYRDTGPGIFCARPNIESETFLRRTSMSTLRYLLRRFTSLRIDDFFQTKYKPDALRSAIIDVVGKRTIEDVKNCRLVIPAVNVSNGQTIVFKTPHLPNMSRDRHFLLSDVLMATTAAPTYFPAAKVGGKLMAVDGGLWANNPSVVALGEATKIYESLREDVDAGFSLDEVHMLSIGTGKPAYSIAPPEEAGFAWWGPKIYDVASTSQSQGTDFQMKYLLGNRYRRIDFDLPDASWSLDACHCLDQLISKGSTTAHEHLNQVLDVFTAEEASPYVPFPETCHQPPVFR